MTAAAGFSLDEMVRRDYRDRDGQRWPLHHLSASASTSAAISWPKFERELA